MTIRERLHELKSVEDVDAFLEKFPTSALFKAGGCHKTMQGFGFVEEALNSYDDLHLGAVRVIEHRPASNYIAEYTGITHQSPQFILLIDGKSVYDVDNWNITLEDLDRALTTFCGEVKGEEIKKSRVNFERIAVYIDLLHRFVIGELTDEEFSSQWLQTFQKDSSLRSSTEFTLLNSLFGNVDDAMTFGAPPCSVHLKVRSRELLEKLRS